MERLPTNKINAFTLIELLVVIAIIGILSSVAVINLNSSRELAKKAAVAAVMTQLKPAIILCFDNGEELYLDMELHNEQYAVYLVDPGGVMASFFEMPICPGSDVYWPIFFDKGWHYTDYLSDSNDVQWGIVFMNEAETASIECSHAGCDY